MLEQIYWKKCELLRPGERAFRVLKRLSRGKWVSTNQAREIVSRVTRYPSAMRYALGEPQPLGYIDGEPPFFPGEKGRSEFICLLHKIRAFDDNKKDFVQVKIFIRLLEIKERYCNENNV